MAQPKTQDTQKVFRSALEKFSSFNGAVEGVSSTKHMTEIYDNMTKLFDTFTQGALTEQGANSEIVLRTIYRSLSDDFLKIVQDTSAVDKIVEVLKEKQKSISPENVDQAMVSETTKKVVTKTLDPNDCDIMSVVVDFVDELQTAILQVKINLTREYERQKIQRAKSIEGQKEDLERLNQEFQVQSDATMETIQAIHDWDQKWTDEQLERTETLVKTFNQVGGLDGDKPYLNEINDWLKDDKDIRDFLKKSNFKVGHLVDIIHRTSDQIERLKQKRDESRKQSSEKEFKPPVSPPASVPQPSVAKEKGEKQKARKDNSSLDNIQEKQTGKLLDDTSKISGQVEKQKKDKGMEQVLSGKQNKGIGTKINSSPKNGMCVCPICGNSHCRGPSAHVQGSKMSFGPKLAQLDKSQGNDSKIDQSGVLSNLGIIHGNIQQFIKGNKLKKAFSVNYGNIQKIVGKQLKKTDSDEMKVNRDLEDTQEGVRKLKRKSSGSWLCKFIFGGGPAMIMFTIAGGLVLITLARVALRQWKKKYMPTTDPRTFTILGVPIPGVNTIKAIGLGIWNFIVVGIPEYYGRIKNFFGKIYNELFGKNGCIRNVDMMVLTLKKIVAAWIIGHTKKAVGGWIGKLLLKLAKVIPGWGTALAFVAELAPQLYSFIATQLMLLWAKGQESKISSKDDLEAQMKRESQKSIKQLKKKLKVVSSGVQPFVPPGTIPGLITPDWNPGDVNANRPRPTSILKKAKKPDGLLQADTRLKKENQRTEKAYQYKIAYSEMFEGAENAYQYARAEKNKNTFLAKLFWAVSELSEFLYKTGKVIQDEPRFNRSPKLRKQAQDIRGERYSRLWNRSPIHGLINARVQQLEGVIKQLSDINTKRFGNIQGALYDGDTGWNPGLRVFQQDLMTPVPTNPFGEIHARADIPFGIAINKPNADGSDEGEGYSPFKWRVLGTKEDVVANPIAFEIVRLKAMQDFLKSILSITSTYWVEPKEIQHLGFADDKYGTINSGNLVPVLAKVKWYEEGYNSPSTEASLSAGAKYKIKYYYGKQFSQWLAARSLGYYSSDNENTFQQFHKRVAAGGWETQRREGPDQGLTQSQKDIRHGYFVQKNAIVISEQQQGADDYKEEMKKHESAEGGSEGWKKRFDETVGRFWKVGVGNVTYGHARTLMLADGIAHLFDRNGINGPITWAAHIMEKMVANGFWENTAKVSVSTDDVKRLGDLVFLMRKFIMQKYNPPKDYDWNENVYGPKNMYIVNAFATSLLEYFGYMVLPQWKIVEKALIGYTNGTTDEKSVNDQIVKLLELLDGQAIIEFMFKHIRFKNATVKVIDYGMEGLTDEQIKELDKWRRKRGIPLSGEKPGILSGWESLYGKFGSMSESELREHLSTIEKQIMAAAYEAKFTGNHEYENDLRKYYQAAYDAYRSSAGMAEASKLPSLGIQNPQPMSGKSPAEQREEERKQQEEDRKRLEEERRKNEEETAKRLAEEAERKKKVAEAEAKIKAMEAIKRQEQAYESMLEKLVKDPGSVSEKELSSFGDDVKNLKQEAENRINELPREEREIKLALIRGDNLSDKTFKEMKDTAIGLHGSLQGYIEEVNKIPVGSVLAIQNQPGGGQTTVPQIDTDKVDMGD